MLSKKPLINILVSIVIIVAVFFIYRFFFPSSKTVSQQAAGLESVTLTEDGQEEAQDEFLRLLLSLQALDFKTDVFDLIHKGGFQDFTVQLVPKTPGRTNPFAPIGVGSRPSSSTTTPKNQSQSAAAGSLQQALNP